MKLYKTTYIDDGAKSAYDEHKEIWHGTQADASKARKVLKIEGMREIATDETDVPTDKAGLLAFLNSRAG